MNEQNKLLAGFGALLLLFAGLLGCSILAMHRVDRAQDQAADAAHTLDGAGELRAAIAEMQGVEHELRIAYHSGRGDIIPEIRDSHAGMFQRFDDAGAATARYFDQEWERLSMEGIRNAEASWRRWYQDLTGGAPPVDEDAALDRLAGLTTVMTQGAADLSAAHRRQLLWADTENDREVVWAHWLQAALILLGIGLTIWWTRKWRAQHQELIETRERFRVAAESSGELIYDWDLRTDEVQILGRAGLPVPLGPDGRPVKGSYFVSRIIHEDDRERVRAAMQRNLERGEPYRENFRAVFPSGVRHWADAGSALRDRSGKPYRWVGVVKDVTEALAAERANAQLAAIVESAETAILSRDMEGKILTWNTGAERIYGFTATEMLGRNVEVLVPADRMEEHIQISARIAAGERVNHLETVRVTKGGQTVDVLMAVAPVRDRSNRIVGAAYLVWDISEFRHLQNQLAQAQKLESIGQLAAGIAHEINTPIQYVGDNAEFLSQAFQDLTRFVNAHETADAGDAAAIGRIREEIDVEYLCREIPRAIEQLAGGVQQVARIVRAMKEFSHPGSAEKVMLDINRAIESAVVVSRNEWKYAAELTTEFDPTLPMAPCFAGEFNQVMLNLIVNAAHAIADVQKTTGAKGRIQISTRANGDWAEIRVSDSGTGIPAEIRDKVFDPFFTTKGVGKGTGQGLSIAHNVIVKKHAGKLSFQTQTGVGTTFLVQLPLDAALQAPEAIQPSTPQAEPACV